jgi:hypothetical protein
MAYFGLTNLSEGYEFLMDHCKILSQQQLKTPLTWVGQTPKEIAYASLVLVEVDTPHVPWPA